MSNLGRGRAMLEELSVFPEFNEPSDVFGDHLVSP